MGKPQICNFIATSTILIHAFLRSADLKRVAQYPKFSVARDYTITREVIAR